MPRFRQERAEAAANMTQLLELRQAYKSYGEQVLLDGDTIVFHDNRKAGMIGRNGAGKSTLARILLGEEELDAGEVVRHKTLRLGYLRQHDPFLPGETVLDFLLRDSGRPDWRCGEVAGRFELKGARLAGRVDALSGGWQSRVKLAALLLQEPNFLILDEPTNFLDLSTQLLLERFLRSFAGGCLVISHDRGFLRSVCDLTVELARGKLYSYPGSVDAYLEQKRQRAELAARANVNVAARMRQLQTFIDKNRAGANTASQARNKQKQLDRLELIEIDSPESTAGMRLPPVETRAGVAVECAELAIGYPDREVASGVRLEIEHGSRVAVVGDNGQGKTTLLRTLTGDLAPRTGTVRWGFGCELGVYAQHVYLALPEHLKVRDYLLGCAAPGTASQTVLNLAGSFLFDGDSVDKPVRVLSGGERARLCLAGLFLQRHNVLVLDEPVNHLDVETAGELAGALEKFPGTVIFTSHDRSFMERVATRVVEVRDGGVSACEGDYARYLERLRRRIDEEDLSPDPRPGAAEPAQRGGKERARERYRLEKEAAALERQISRQQEQLAAADRELRPDADWQKLAELHRHRDGLAARLAELEEQWLALQERIESLGAL